MVLVRKGPLLWDSPAKTKCGSPRGNHSLRISGGLRSCAKSLSKHAAGTGTNVKVVVRVRPPNKKEVAANAKLAVSVIDEKMLIFDPKEEEPDSFFFRGTQQKGRDMLKRQHKHTEFLFDRVFGYESTNQQVFEESTKDIITHVLDGYNCSVFVYGATGAGKTFTMLGTEQNPGVMFLTMVNLFERMEELKHERDIEMAVSYLEVYNECVHDLIVKSAPLYLREDANGVIVSGLKVEKITNTNRLFELLAEGNKNRTQHPTDANAESSRSHAVFQVYLKMCNKGSNQKKMVKLSMIDLAGSERGSATNFAGARFKEGSSINKSLLALGNCINKLADGLPHIPYRDSKLTRILKDSLSGNCRTVMIANVSPSSLSFEDTHNTLRYAKRAKLIKSMVKKNIVSVEMHVSHYIKMVDDLKEENARLKAELQKAEAALEVSKVTLAATPVYLTPVKAAPVESKISPKPNTIALSALLKEVEKVYSEKEDLQKRYLQMDSNEKILMFRMQCKERSVARVQQLCGTPTNTDEAKFRACRSMKQFTGQLKSAVGCQAGLADQRGELDDQLKSLRQKASSVGLLEEFVDKTAKMDLQFQNVELKEQLAHLHRVMTLMNKEKDDQDQVMTELSSAFRHYFNLLRGHGHMTEAMLKEHKSLVRRVEGLKSVNWDTEEKRPGPGAGPGPSPLKSISKLSLTDSPGLSNIVPNRESSDSRCESETSVLAVNKTYCSTTCTCDVAQFKQDLNLIDSLKPVLNIDLETPVVLESSDEVDLCITGKFAKLNATFEKLPKVDSMDKIDATITKVENLLNESTMETLNLTFDKGPVLNKTFDADLNNTYDADMNKTYDMNERATTEPLQAAEPLLQTIETLESAKSLQLVEPLDTNDPLQSADKPESVKSLLSRTPKVESVDMNSTYQFMTDAAAAAAATAITDSASVAPAATAMKSTKVNSTVHFSKPKTCGSTCPTGVPKYLKPVLPKRPLQENNSRPKRVSPMNKWRTTLPGQSLVKGAQISAQTILERKLPLNHAKPKGLLGNKENGILRRPGLTTRLCPTVGGPRAISSSNAK